jgi:hypothetical protein
MLTYTTPALAEQLTQATRPTFYTTADFWIMLLIGTAALVFSILAFLEARKAKKAAFEAGRAVKLQTITVELAEIALKLDHLNLDLDFVQARDLLNEVSRRLRRWIAGFASDPNFREAVTNLITILDSGQVALEEVRPRDNNLGALPPNAVYFAMQGIFATISARVAQLMGLFEEHTRPQGDQ